MQQALTPIARQTLSDGLAERVRKLIRSGRYQPGDRLPTIAEMAQRFGVGHPTLREALKKLETLGIVTIRHGSGVYVGRDDNSLLISNPVYSGSISKKLLVDLMDARMSLELTTVQLAAINGTSEHLERMRSLLDQAGQCLGDDAVLSAMNMAFHREIAVASGNVVLGQLLEVLTNVFQEEQRVILSIYGSREKDHYQHIEIVEALEAHDADLAVERMRAHLEGVRNVLLKWDPEAHPAV